MLILESLENNVLTLTLNRPEKFNSFIKEMALDLQAKLDAAKDNPEVRCIVITGAGKAFCAGQDLNEVLDPEGPALERIVHDHFNPIVERVRNIEKPIVAAVNGVAAGAGANLAIACDMAIAKKSTAFIQAFSKIGLIPDTGGTYFLPRIVGMQKAAALMMLGSKLLAEEAERINVIYKAVEDDVFDQEVAALSQKLAAMPTKALGLTKRALNKTWHNELTKQLAIEEQLQFAAAQTDDYKEGVDAFLEKRKPTFTGN